MPIKQLQVVEKIKSFVTGSMRSKKQIVAEAKEDAREHRVINQQQEKQDDALVNHAQQELAEEDRIENYRHARLLNALAISVFINLIFLILIAIGWYFLFYR